MSWSWAAALPGSAPPPRWRRAAPACWCSRRGRRSAAGRRRSPIPATGEPVDNGQHVVAGAYYETFEFLGRIGAMDGVRMQTSLELEIVEAERPPVALRLSAAAVAAAPPRRAAAVAGAALARSARRASHGPAPRAGARTRPCGSGCRRWARRRGSSSCSGSRWRWPRSISRLTRRPRRRLRRSSTGFSRAVPRPRWVSP